MFNWLGEILGSKEIHKRINDLESRVDELERRIRPLEDSTALILGGFGDYKNRTDAELKLMELQISTLLEQINNVLDTLESAEGIARVKTLRSRLRNNLTRIRNVREA
jgi:archaellum component FlaC